MALAYWFFAVFRFALSLFQKPIYLLSSALCSPYSTGFAYPPPSPWALWAIWFLSRSLAPTPQCFIYSLYQSTIVNSVIDTYHTRIPSPSAPIHTLHWPCKFPVAVATYIGPPTTRFRPWPSGKHSPCRLCWQCPPSSWTSTCSLLAVPCRTSRA